MRNTPAIMVTFAAPAMPNCDTAAARKGTVTVDGPPIKTGLRPSSAVKGAVMIELNSPNSGGNPISAAIANPYGRAMSAAISPPKPSPQRCRQE